MEEGTPVVTSGLLLSVKHLPETLDKKISNSLIDISSDEIENMD